MAGFSRSKYLKLAKGFYGRSKNCASTMIPRVHKSLQKAYIGRKLRPRTLRRDWIATIGASVQQHAINYSRFICGLNRSNVVLDRKILADLAMNEPYSFKAIVDEVKVQFKYESPRKYTIEEMVKKNLLTSAKLEAEIYKQKPPTGIPIGRPYNDPLP